MSSADPRIRQYKKEEATIRKLVFVLLLLLVLLGFYLVYRRVEAGNAPEPLVIEETEDAVLASATVATTTVTTTPATFPVHLAGAVVRPGVYYVTEGTILDTVLQEAGGFSIVADQSKVNLAMSLAAHQYVYIPELGEETVPTPVTPVGGDQAAKSEQETPKVNINTADEAELTTLSGVGPSTAQKIIAYREENGPFQAIEDLMNVPGIKEGRFAGLKDFITIE